MELHRYYSTFVESDGINRMFALFQQTQDEETRIHITVCICRLFKSREIANQEMKTLIIAHLKTMINNPDSWQRNESRIALKSLAKNPNEMRLEDSDLRYVVLEKENHKEIVVMDLKKVDFLAGLLQNQMFTVSKIHGGMEMPERNQMMKDFREGRSRVLITIDLLSRGIEIPQVLIVMNYDVSTEKEQYIHCIGRSARFG
ncbi:MAG: putative ATP-dependent RNA helicase [Streblomastix strix]|uniref:Putative ATP-dependent RNA helicase n=1 Tax=Streblomastix strix TaxID=222440 RepID=A0A5J4WFI5_9EUKA|nr:MAG: putative ATP-dependent RNA helicase [Streblomastix strix]